MALQFPLGLHMGKVADPWLLSDCYLVSNMALVKSHGLFTALLSHSLCELAGRLERFAVRLVVVLLHRARSRLIELLLGNSVVHHRNMTGCDVPVLHYLVHIVRFLEHLCRHHLLQL